MKISSLFPVVALAAASLLPLGAAEPHKIAYPTADDASFILTVPADWEIKQAEEAGDYFTLSKESGATFSFRTIEGEKETLDQAIEDSMKEIGERFDGVQMSEAQDWTPGGLKGFYSAGGGKEKDGGAPVRIGVGWLALPDGKIAELWFVADQDDTQGITEAEAIANTLETP